MAYNIPKSGEAIDESKLWEGMSGLQVEEFLKTKLSKVEDASISNIMYDPSSRNLVITQSGGNEFKATIVNAEPSYSYLLDLYKITVNGTELTENQYFQVNSSLKVLAYVAVNATMTITESIDRTVTLYATFTFNGTTIRKPITTIAASKFNNGVFATTNEDVVPVDITELFTETVNNQAVSVTLIPDYYTESTYIPSDTSVTFTTQKLGVSTTTQTITNTKAVSFTIDSSLDSKLYDIILFNNGRGESKTSGIWQPYKVLGSSNSLTFEELNLGLNQIMYKLVYHNDYSIGSDWQTVDIIFIGNDTDGYFDGSAVAVNDVSSKIANNGVVDLANITVYSANDEDVTVKAYLADNYSDYDGTEIKRYVFTASDYDNHRVTTTLQKYIEINSYNATKLITLSALNINYPEINVSTSISGPEGEVPIYFYSYVTPEWNSTYNPTATVSKLLTIEAIDTTLIKYQGATTILNFDQSTGQTNNVFKTKLYYPDDANLNTLQPQDGWKDESGRTVFKISALELSYFKEDLSLNLGEDFTLEFGLKTYNISDENKSLIELGSLQIRPTQICWDVDISDSAANQVIIDAESGRTLGDANREKFYARNSGFLEELETFIAITLQKNFSLSTSDAYYPDYIISGTDTNPYNLNYQTDSSNVFANYAKTINLLNIYINGVIDRLIALTDADIEELGSTLKIMPQSCDVDFSTLRVYNNNALTEANIRQDYISFLRTKVEKQNFYKLNDIADSNGKISFAKASKLYDCLLYVFPKGIPFPNRFYGAADNTDSATEKALKAAHTTLFVWYANLTVNAKYGGRLNHGLMKGQGSSAKRYLIWNSQFSLGKQKYTADVTGTYAENVLAEDGETVLHEKGESYVIHAKGDKYKSEFVPFSSDNLKGDTYKFVDEPTVSLKNAYLIPTNGTTAEDDGIKVKKLVGKVNFASSMQSHKEGACDLFEEAHPNQISGQRHAVKELPFLYFYVETDLEDVSNVSLSDVSAKAKFMGFQTWGSGKCDDATFGYDSDTTPEYILMEGGENEDHTVNFKTPWLDLLRSIDSDSTTYQMTNYPVVTYAQSIEDPTAGLYLLDESIWYSDKASWDVDYGIEEYDSDVKKPLGDKTWWYFTEPAKVALKKFRDFYDFAYKYDCNLQLAETGSASSTWDKRYKYVVVDATRSDLPNYARGNIYRYDNINELWVSAGTEFTPVSSGSGGTWSTLNITDLTGFSVDVASDIDNINRAIRTKVYELMGNYVDVADVAYHQAFIKFVSGTDNRAKNTYFRIKGPTYVKNDEGTYVQPDSVSTSDYLVTLVQDDLDTIFLTDNAGLQSKQYNLLEPSYVPSTSSQWGDGGNNVFFRSFDQAFEEDIKVKLRDIITYAFAGNYDVNSTGTKFYQEFFKVQTTYPAIAYNMTAYMYYVVGKFVKDSMVLGNLYTNNGEDPIELSHGSCLEAEKQFMAKRLGLLASYSQAYTSVGLDTNGAGAEGSTINLTLDFTPYLDFYPTFVWGSNTLLKYLLTNEEEVFDTLSKIGYTDKEYTDVTFAPSDTKITQGLPFTDLYKTISISGSISKNNIAALFKHATKVKLSGLSIETLSLTLPVVEELTFSKCKLPSTVDFSGYYKLKRLDLSGCTNVTKVILPQTDSLVSVSLPATITSLELYNNPNLTTITLADPTAITSLYLGTVTSLNTTALISQLTGLLSVTIKGDIALYESDANRLINLASSSFGGALSIVDSTGALASVSWSTAKAMFRLNKLNYSSISWKKTTISTFSASLTMETSDILDMYDVLTSVNGTNLTSNTFTFAVTSGTATISSKGYLTPDGTSATVSVTLASTGATRSVSITFGLHIAEVGDFAYGDGKFSSTYDSSKDLMGIVYATSKSTENGSTYTTAYIMGSSFVTNKSGSTLFYGGFDSGINSDNYSSLTADLSSATSDAAKLGALTTGRSSLVSSFISGLTGIKTATPASTDLEGDIDASNFSGAENTSKIVASAKTALLESGTYSVPTSTSDVLFTQTLSNYTSTYADFLLGAPYYYAAYLYEPAHSGTLDDLYKSTNWYVPDLYQIYQVLQQRAVSAVYNNVHRLMNIFESISDSSTASYNGIKPIFAIVQAKNPGIPCLSTWSTFFNGFSSSTCQLSSAVSPNSGSALNSYSYALNAYSTSESGASLSYSMGYIPYYSWNSSATSRLWCANTHINLPFVTYKLKHAS